MVGILVYKSSTLKNNNFFEMSISRKTDKFLEFFWCAYVVLLIKQHKSIVNTLSLHILESYWAISIFHIKLNIPFVSLLHWENGKALKFWSAAW